LISLRNRAGPWKRHVAVMPKGFLKVQILGLLARRQMSGAEIMDEVERMTGWRPGPGSVYPILTRLEEGGYIKGGGRGEGEKRYTATAKGRRLLDSLRTIRSEILEGEMPLPPPFLLMAHEIPPEVCWRLRAVMRRMMTSIREAVESGREKEIERVLGILERAARQMEGEDRK